MDGHVDLGASLESYVDRLVQEGGFASREEVIREGVRLIQEREQRWAELDSSVARGLADIEAGRVYPIEDVMAEMRGRYSSDSETRKRG